MNSGFITQWVIPILTSIIAAIIIFLFQKSVGFGKSWWAKGTIQEKVRGTFKSKDKTNILKFILSLIYVLSAIGYNLWLLISVMNDTSKPNSIKMVVLTVVIVMLVFMGIMLLIMQWAFSGSNRD